MARKIAYRLLRMILTVLLIYTIVFFFSRVTGDPVEFMTMNSGVGAEEKANLAHQLGLDQPLWKQYTDSLTGILTGNAGNSFYYNRPVDELFAERLFATLSIGLLAFLVTAVLGILLGFISALNYNTWIDRLILAITVVGNTIPSFVLAILLILFFALRLRVLPSGGYGDFRYMIMPVIAMSVAPTSNVARLTRSSLLDIFSSDFLNTSRAKGMKEIKVKVKHGLRNAMIPVVTILGSQLSGIIGGTVVIETVSAWPGLGQLIINGARQRDFPLVVYGVMVIAISVSLIYFIVDIIYMYLDPRIRITD